MRRAKSATAPWRYHAATYRSTARCSVASPPRHFDNRCRAIVDIIDGIFDKLDNPSSAAPLVPVPYMKLWAGFAIGVGTAPPRGGGKSEDDIGGVMRIWASFPANSLQV